MECPNLTFDLLLLELCLDYLDVFEVEVFLLLTQGAFRRGG